MSGRISVFFILVGCAGLAVAGVNAATGTPASASTKKAPAKKKKSVPSRKLPDVDPTLGDNVDGDDLVIRRAAVASLGRFNGSVVAMDPDTGRVLTIVNQKLAYKPGFIPCSTIKLVTALAALSEGIVDRESFIPVGRRTTMNLTTAVAKSNNPYFAVLGKKLGFEKVSYYARLFGLGERAGLDIPGEQPGTVPDEPPANGGVGMMCSFGEGVSLTPLQLAALLGAISNNGTLYYLQYPRTPEEIQQFTPRIKRRLEIAKWLPDLKVGMRAAVDFGTARQVDNDPTQPVMGKTGTCTDFRSSNHMGWFGSFNDVGHNRLVVVVMLTGNHAVNGPVAAGVAGRIYHALSDQKYFAQNRTPESKNPLPDMVVTMPSCCGK